MDKILDDINNNKWENAISILKDNLNKKILDGNSILHLACIRGDENAINAFIEMSKQSDNNNPNILLSNKDGNNILHLLIKNGWNNLAVNVAKVFPELIGMINNREETPILLSTDRIELFIELFFIMDKNKQNNKLRIVDRVSATYDTILKKIISNLSRNESYQQLFEQLLKMGVNTEIPTQLPPLIFALEQKYNNAVLTLLEFGCNPNVKDSSLYSPINIACSSDNFEGARLLFEFGADIEYGGPENDYLPVNICINKKYYSILEVFMKQIKNYDIKDRFMNTYLHYLLASKLQDKNVPDDIILHFLKRSRLDARNIDGITPLNILLKLPNWKEYKKIIQENDIILNVNDTFALKDIDEQKYLEIIEKKIKYNKPIGLVINKQPSLIPVVKMSGVYGLFNSDGIHNILYTLNLLQKYKQLSIPYTEYNKKKHKEIVNNFILQDIDYDGFYKVMYSIIELYYRYFYEAAPHIVLWKNKDLFYFHNDFDKCLKESGKNNKRFILIKISLIPSVNGTHANVVLIDKKNNTARRFEPYGITDIFDGDELDNILHKKIKKSINNKIKYYRPNDFLSLAKFQTISGDTYDTNKKLGDPVGYCLAWCLWYVELKLNNPDIEENKLIEDTLNEIYYKYKDDDNPFLVYIRAYAKKLDEDKNTLLNSFGISEKYYYDTNPKDKNMEKISNGFSKFFE